MRLRDVGWLVFAGVCTVFGLVAALGIIGAVIQRRWLLAATAPLYVLGAYWLAAGAWLRTEQGKENLGAPPPGPPQLSARRATVLIALAAACALACAIALGGQWIATR